MEELFLLLFYKCTWTQETSELHSCRKRITPPDIPTITTFFPGHSKVRPSLRRSRQRTAAWGMSLQASLFPCRVSNHSRPQTPLSAWWMCLCGGMLSQIQMSAPEKVAYICDLRLKVQPPRQKWWMGHWACEDSWSPVEERDLGCVNPGLCYGCVLNCDSSFPSSKIQVLLSTYRLFTLFHLWLGLI